MENARPALQEQEHLLYTLLQGTGRIDTPLIPIIPIADTEAVCVLVRTLAGLEDFARCNAHFPRRSILSVVAYGPYRRFCLTCLINYGRHVLDSEWHAFLDCPEHESARGRFSLKTDYVFSHSLPSLAEDLTPLFTFVRNDIHFVGQLAKFSLNIRSTRRHNFRRLSSGGQLGRNKVIMRVAWERWKAGVFHMIRHVDLCFLGRNSRE